MDSIFEIVEDKLWPEKVRQPLSCGHDVELRVHVDVVDWIRTKRLVYRNFGGHQIVTDKRAVRGIKRIFIYAERIRTSSGQAAKTVPMEDFGFTARQKRCARCGCWQDESKFNLRHKDKTDLQSWCKDCMSEYFHTWAAENRGHKKPRG